MNSSIEIEHDSILEYDVEKKILLLEDVQFKNKLLNSTNEIVVFESQTGVPLLVTLLKNHEFNKAEIAIDNGYSIYEFMECGDIDAQIVTYFILVWPDDIVVRWLLNRGATLDFPVKSFNYRERKGVTVYQFISYCLKIMSPKSFDSLLNYVDLKHLNFAGMAIDLIDVKVFEKLALYIKYKCGTFIETFSK